MFRDAKQRARSCNIFMIKAGIRNAFDVENAELKGGFNNPGLSHGQKMFWAFAYELWTGEEKGFSLVEAMRRWDSDSWNIFQMFISSYSDPDKIDDWLRVMERKIK